MGLRWWYASEVSGGRGRSLGMGLIGGRQRVRRALRGGGTQLHHIW